MPRAGQPDLFTDYDQRVREYEEAERRAFALEEERLREERLIEEAKARQQLLIDVEHARRQRIIDAENAHKREIIAREKQRIAVLQKDCSKFYFSWDEHIEFDKNIVRFTDPKKRTLLPPLPLKGSLPILNRIKNEFFARLFRRNIIKLYYRDRAFDLAISPDWSTLYALIQPALEFASFRYDHFPTQQKRLVKFSKLDNASILHLFREPIDKSVFLQHLAMKHHADLPVIPVLEYRSKAQEESFIFRVLTLTGDILIFWENALDRRATHVFRATPDNHQQRLERIESFIISETDAKRSLLHDNDSNARAIKRDLGYIRALEHEDAGQYTREIQYLINQY